MNRLPEPEARQPHATQAGQPTPDDSIRRQAAEIAAAVDAVYEQPTAIRIDDPTVPSWQDGARIGTTPPVTQPGRPPMSQRAVDLNTTILTSSVLTAVASGGLTAVLWASHHANATVIAWICGCAVAVPAAIALPVLALKSLMKSTKEVVEAAPPVIHQHFNGTVHQDARTVHTRTSGVWASTRNELPAARRDA